MDSSGLSSLTFWGVEVPPGDGVEVDVEQGEDFVEMLHLTNVALGSKAKKERVTLFVELPEGQRHAVGSLELGRCEQFQVDMVQAGLFKLVHTGSSSVSVTGYKTTTVNDELSDFEDDDDDEDMEGSDEEAPAGVPIQRAMKAGQESDESEGEEDEGEEGEEGESSEEESEEEEGGSEDESMEMSEGDEVAEIMYDSDEADRELKFDKMAARKVSGEDSESDAESDEESDEGTEDGEMEGGDESEEESDEMEGGDESEEESDEMSDEESDEEPPVGAKRKGGAPITPEAKKAKTPLGAITPKQTPKPTPRGGKAPVTPMTPGDAKMAWEANVVEVLQKEGPQTLGALGGKAKKPEGLTLKLKTLIGTSKRLKMDGDKVVLEEKRYDRGIQRGTRALAETPLLDEYAPFLNE